MAAFGKRLLRALPLLLLAPFLLVLAAIVMALTDLASFLWGRKQLVADGQPSARAASVVIPNWNGQDLLARYIPSVEAALAGNPENELIVVDNGSTDGLERDVSARAFSGRAGGGAGTQPGVRWRIERGISSGAQRHRRSAEQRHAGGA